MDLIFMLFQAPAFCRCWFSRPQLGGCVNHSKTELRSASAIKYSRVERRAGAPCLLVLQAVIGMAAMVPDDEDAHAIAHHSIEERLGKAFEGLPA